MWVCGVPVLVRGRRRYWFAVGVGAGQGLGGVQGSVLDAPSLVALSCLVPRGVILFPVPPGGRKRSQRPVGAAGVG